MMFSSVQFTHLSIRQRRNLVVDSSIFKLRKRKSSVLLCWLIALYLCVMHTCKFVIYLSRRLVNSIFMSGLLTVEIYTLFWQLLRPYHNNNNNNYNNNNFTRFAVKTYYVYCWNSLVLCVSVNECIFLIKTINEAN